MCVDTTCGAIKLNFLASGRRWLIVIGDRLLPILKCVKISRNSCTTTRSRKKEKATWLLFSLEVQGDRDIYVNFYFHPLKKMCCVRCLVNVPSLAAPRWPARSRASGWTPSRTWRAVSRATQRHRAPRARRRPPLPPPCPPCWRPATSSRSRAAILTGYLDNIHNNLLPRYSYKNITSCDVCSQIMKGNTRQGLKCKLCRMNVHPECQDRVVKCQPKAKFSRMKSGSEMGDDEREMSIDYICKIKLCVQACQPEGRWAPTSGDRTSSAPSPAPRRATRCRSCWRRRRQVPCYLPPRYRRVTHRCAGGELGTDSSPIRRKMGGSYSRYTGAAPLSQLQRGLTIDTRYRRR